MAYVRATARTGAVRTGCLRGRESRSTLPLRCDHAFQDGNKWHVSHAMHDSLLAGQERLSSFGEWTHWNMSTGPPAFAADVMPRLHVPLGTSARGTWPCAAARHQALAFRLPIASHGPAARKCAEPRRDTSPTRHQKATSMTLCRHTGSSQGPPDLQSDARPAELSMHMIHSHTPDESLAHTYGDAEAEQQTHASPVAAVLLGCAKDKFDSQTRTAGAIRSRGCDGRGVAPWRGPSTGQAIKILLSPQPPPLPPTHEATQNL